MYLSGGHVEGCTQLSTAVYEIVNSCSFSVMSNQLSNSCGVHPYRYIGYIYYTYPYRKCTYLFILVICLRISAPHLPISYFQTYKLTGVVSGLSLLIVTCLAILFVRLYSAVSSFTSLNTCWCDRGLPTLFGLCRRCASLSS